MRRRIERSRARCQKAAAAHKVKRHSPEPKPRADKLSAAPPAVALWRVAESQVV